MNNLYRLKRLWPIFSEANAILKYSHRKSNLKDLQKVQACFYCKKYGLYDDEDEESFGEVNRRGAYVNHRANAFEEEGRPSPRRGFGGRGRRDIYNDDEDDADDNFDEGSFSRGRPTYDRYDNRGPRGSYGRDSFGSQRQSYGGPRPYGQNRYSNRFERNQNDFYSQPSSRRSSAPPAEMKNLPPLEKCFYVEHEDVERRTAEEVDEYRRSVDITIKGRDVPKPVMSFDELCISDSLKNVMMQENFEKPTMIQAQGWPIVLSGRDMIGISQTGSGKTFVFALPAMIHITKQDQPDRAQHERCPQALVLAPTRELAQQIHSVCQKFQHPCGVNSACVYGGASKVPQLQNLRNAQICIATPGRLLDYIQQGAVSLGRCSYVVLDEADRMLDMGFEPQIREIIQNTRRERQTLMWSATWPTEVQVLAEDFLNDYIQVTVGSEDLTANPNITQNVYVMNQADKNTKLVSMLRDVSRAPDSKVLVFAQTKRTVDYLTRSLNQSGIISMAIHGDISQAGRDRALSRFRNMSFGVLIATDVAARGLDVSNINHVVNYDFPQNIEDYIHRIGRTARGEKTGFSHSFFTEDDASLARKLVKVIEDVGQTPPTELVDLIQRSVRSNRRPFPGRYQQRYGNY